MAAYQVYQIPTIEDRVLVKENEFLINGIKGTIERDPANIVNLGTPLDKNFHLGFLNGLHQASTEIKSLIEEVRKLERVQVFLVGKIALWDKEDELGLTSLGRFTEVFDDPNDFTLTSGHYSTSLQRVEVL